MISDTALSALMLKNFLNDIQVQTDVWLRNMYHSLLCVSITESLSVGASKTIERTSEDKGGVISCSGVYVT